MLLVYSLEASYWYASIKHHRKHFKLEIRKKLSNFLIENESILSLALGMQLNAG